ncbi:MAG: spore coat protein [Candidatus Nealsonbacteria bacterium CG10_big_fil_rev_8_21_14_0_10_36_24]|uniref:glucose-1-phosphate thymidylyltransferase n=2 Tax=Candidatus Nealsoniibacteriota TaxID=1817911 RepID=A0A2H0YNL5_9BACT|nr:MAG: spore coat protein [Candidatus Nealsonbacteria bacterium CG10_big_fil_rev_8_21_14_0_10_36_24]PIS40078.1 MAG: spore coat protein [Candidatus Nealsonbacteria bacterium CG08_land_8_20_14_0_20_36_22]
MKAVILAGGFATRLSPITKVTNKHLLPVYNKPLIFYAIEKLVAAFIDRIIIVTSPWHINDFVNLLGSGQGFISKNTGKQIQIVYGIQNEPSGIAQGLYIAKDYIGQDNSVLYLGDNIFEDDLTSYIRDFQEGAMVFLKQVEDPRRFGIVTVDENNKVLEIEEKPQKPKSNLAVTGLYIYDKTVFDKMIGQSTSERGEYEISYINNLYIKEEKLKAVLLKKEWFDAGTFDSLLQASCFMQKKYREKEDKN